MCMEAKESRESQAPTNLTYYATKCGGSAQNQDTNITAVSKGPQSAVDNEMQPEACAHLPSLLILACLDRFVLSCLDLNRHPLWTSAGVQQIHPYLLSNEVFVA